MSARRVLVTDAGRGSAIAVIRSLGRAGWEVTAADSTAASAGFRSRFAAHTLVYPDPLQDPEGVVELLLAEATNRGIDLIIPVSDELLLPLSAARERFAGVSALAMPDAAALDQVSDKAATVALAQRLGVPVPRTKLVATTAEALAAAPALGWPLVVKPARSRVVRPGGVDRFQVTYAESPEVLARVMAGLEGRVPVLLQEYRAGEGHGVELLLDDGEVLLAFQHRRLHEVPITGGASALRESVPLDPAMLDQATRLMRELKWTGLAMVEFLVGDGRATLMEINGRIWGSLPLAVKSGADFPLGLARLHTGGPPPGGPPPRVGVRSRNLRLELIWIGSVLRRARRYPFLASPPRSAGVTAALRLVNPRDGFDVLSREDPSPGLAEVAQVAGALFGKARHAA
ncbi:ATP-grasp domain-containing protein [Baekduia soli]|uniref:ATP-grasp domain-containing protein n=1 Tax=Baekduia soli TaxID=496014 RepID=A0A5B8U886_9ACTN|nr:ATP-grasp domain-containing protein [Baekduia soli]QEC49141.1 ATP-grasp domain-containing protein [Baekduia soli]